MASLEAEKKKEESIDYETKCIWIVKTSQSQLNLGKLEISKT